LGKSGIKLNKTQIVREYQEKRERRRRKAIRKEMENPSNPNPELLQVEIVWIMTLFWL
jgi:hypothetical protein